MSQNVTLTRLTPFGPAVSEHSLQSLKEMVGHKPRQWGSFTCGCTLFVGGGQCSWLVVAACGCCTLYAGAGLWIMGDGLSFVVGRAHLCAVHVIHACFSSWATNFVQSCFAYVGGMESNTWTSVEKPDACRMRNVEHARWTDA